METGNYSYITPHRQRATIDPEDATPPPIIRRQNMECTQNINNRRWADYEEDEPLPEVIFGKKMKPPVVTKKLLKEFISVDDENWRKHDDSWITVKRKSKRNNKQI